MKPAGRPSMGSAPSGSIGGQGQAGGKGANSDYLDEFQSYSEWQRRSVPTFRVSTETTDAQGRRLSLQDIVDRTPSNGRLLLSGGIYSEQLNINKPIEIVNDTGEEVILYSRGPCIVFLAEVSAYFSGIKFRIKLPPGTADKVTQQQSQAAVISGGSASVPLAFLPQQGQGGGLQRTDPPAVLINSGNPVFFKCEMTSIQVCGSAEPVVEGCTITGNLGGSGIIVRDSAAGHYLSNDISDHIKYCIEVSTRGNPIFRKNDIHLRHDDQGVTRPGLGLLKVVGGGKENAIVVDKRALPRNPAGASEQEDNYPLSKNGGAAANVNAPEPVPVDVPTGTHGNYVGTFDTNRFHDIFSESQIEMGGALITGNATKGSAGNTTGRKVITGQEICSQRAIIRIENANIRFTTNQIEGGVVGICVTGTGTELTNNTISNSILCGLYMGPNSNAIVTNDTHTAHHAGGLFLDESHAMLTGCTVSTCKGPAASLNSCTDFSIEKCKFERNRGGIFCSGPTSGLLSENMIIGNELMGMRAAGPGCAPQVTNCTFNHNGSVGISCQRGASPTISKNTIVNHSIAGVVSEHACRPLCFENTLDRNEKYGILCEHGGKGIFSDNKITNSGSGARVQDSSSPTFNANTVKDCVVAFDIASGAAGTVTNNTIDHCAIGVSVTLLADPYVFKNKVSNCAKFGALVASEGLGTFIDNTFTHNNISLAATDGSSPTFRSNTISESGSIGASLGAGSKARLEKNTFQENTGTALLLTGEGCESVATGNFFFRTRGRAIVSEKGAKGSAVKNYFEGNLEGGYGTADGGDTIFYKNTSASDKGPSAFSRQGGLGTFFKNSIESCTASGIHLESGCKPSIRYCTILSCGVAGVHVSDGAEGTIEKCTMKANAKAGLFCTGKCTTELSQLLIEGNEECGILLADGAQALVADSTICGQPTGLKATSAGSAIVTNCDFTDNSVGALIVNAGKSTIENCTFSSSSKYHVEISDNGFATFDKCSFHETGKSAVVSRARGHGIIKNSSIQSAGEYGVIFEVGGNLIVEGCDITNCLVGVVGREKGSGIVRGSNIVANIAANVEVTGSSTTRIESCSVEDCIVGSGIQCFNDAATISNCSVARNRQHGICLGAGSNANIDDNNFIHHNRRSGIYCATLCNAKITNGNKIVSNVEAGISIDSDGTPTITKNTIADNNAGGIICYPSARGTIERNDITANRIANLRLMNSSVTRVNENKISQLALSGGVVIEGSSAILTSNIITKHDHSPGVLVVGYSNAQLRENKIDGNLVGVKFETVMPSRQVGGGGSSSPPQPMLLAPVPPPQGATSKVEVLKKTLHKQRLNAALDELLEVTAVVIKNHKTAKQQQMTRDLHAAAAGGAKGSPSASAFGQYRRSTSAGASSPAATATSANHYGADQPSSASHPQRPAATLGGVGRGAAHRKPHKFNGNVEDPSLPQPTITELLLLSASQSPASNPIPQAASNPIKGIRNMSLGFALDGNSNNNRQRATIVSANAVSVPSSTPPLPPGALKRTNSTSGRVETAPPLRLIVEKVPTKSIRFAGGGDLLLGTAIAASGATIQSTAVDGGNTGAASNPITNSGLSTPQPQAQLGASTLGSSLDSSFMSQNMSAGTVGGGRVSETTFTAEDMDAAFLQRSREEIKSPTSATGGGNFNLMGQNISAAVAGGTTATAVATTVGSASNPLYLFVDDKTSYTSGEGPSLGFDGSSSSFGGLVQEISTSPPPMPLMTVDALKVAGTKSTSFDTNGNSMRKEGNNASAKGKGSASTAKATPAVDTNEGSVKGAAAKKRPRTTVVEGSKSAPSSAKAPSPTKRGASSSSAKAKSDAKPENSNTPLSPLTSPKANDLNNNSIIVVNDGDELESTLRAVRGRQSSIRFENRLGMGGDTTMNDLGASLVDGGGGASFEAMKRKGSVSAIVGANNSQAASLAGSPTGGTIPKSSISTAKLSENIFSRNIECGVFGSCNTNGVLTNNTFEDETIGCKLTSGALGKFEKGTYRRCKIGLLVEGFSISAIISDNLFEENEVGLYCKSNTTTATSGKGGANVANNQQLAQLPPMYVPSAVTVVENNRFDANSRFGMLTSHYSETRIQNNRFENETGVGIGVIFGSTVLIEQNILRKCSVGIQIASSASPTITKNQLIDENDIGIFCCGGSGKILDNVFAKCRVAGLLVEGQSTNPEVTKNLFTGSDAFRGTAAIYTRRQGGGIYYQNDIHENSIGIRSDTNGNGLFHHNFIHDQRRFGAYVSTLAAPTIQQTYFSSNHDADVCSEYCGKPSISRCVFIEGKRPIWVLRNGGGTYSHNLIRGVAEGQSGVVINFDPKGTTLYHYAAATVNGNFAPPKDSITCTSSSTTTTPLTAAASNTVSSMALTPVGSLAALSNHGSNSQHHPNITFTVNPSGFSHSYRDFSASVSDGGGMTFLSTGATSFPISHGRTQSGNINMATNGPAQQLATAMSGMRPMAPVLVQLAHPDVAWHFYQLAAAASSLGGKSSSGVSRANSIMANNAKISPRKDPLAATTAAASYDQNDHSGNTTDLGGSTNDSSRTHSPHRRTISINDQHTDQLQQQHSVPLSPRSRSSSKRHLTSASNSPLSLQDNQLINSHLFVSLSPSTAKFTNNLLAGCTVGFEVDLGGSNKAFLKDVRKEWLQKHAHAAANVLSSPSHGTFVDGNSAAIANGGKSSSNFLTGATSHATFGINATIFPSVSAAVYGLVPNYSDLLAAGATENNFSGIFSAASSPFFGGNANNTNLRSYAHYGSQATINSLSPSVSAAFGATTMGDPSAANSGGVFLLNVSSLASAATSPQRQFSDIKGDGSPLSGGGDSQKMPDLRAITRPHVHADISENYLLACQTGFSVHNGPTTIPFAATAASAFASNTPVLLQQNGVGFGSAASNANYGSTSTEEALDNDADMASRGNFSGSGGGVGGEVPPVGFEDDCGIATFVTNTLIGGDIGIHLKRGGHARFDRNYVYKPNKIGILVSDQGRGEFFENCVMESQVNGIVLQGDRPPQQLSSFNPSATASAAAKEKTPEPNYCNFQGNLVSFCIRIGLIVGSGEAKFFKNRFQGNEIGVYMTPQASGLFQQNIVHDSKRNGAIIMTMALQLVESFFYSANDSGAFEMVGDSSLRMPMGNVVKNQFSPHYSKAHPAVKIIAPFLGIDDKLPEKGARGGVTAEEESAASPNVPTSPRKGASGSGFDIDSNAGSKIRPASGNFSTPTQLTLNSEVSESKLLKEARDLLSLLRMMHETQLPSCAHLGCRRLGVSTVITSRQTNADSGDGGLQDLANTRRDDTDLAAIANALKNLSTAKSALEKPNAKLTPVGPQPNLNVTSVIASTIRAPSAPSTRVDSASRGDAHSFSASGSTNASALTSPKPAPAKPPTFEPAPAKPVTQFPSSKPPRPAPASRPKSKSAAKLGKTSEPLKPEEREPSAVMARSGAGPSELAESGKGRGDASTMDAHGNAVLRFGNVAHDDTELYRTESFLAQGNTTTHNSSREDDENGNALQRGAFSMRYNGKPLTENQRDMYLGAGGGAAEEQSPANGRNKASYPAWRHTGPRGDVFGHVGGDPNDNSQSPARPQPPQDAHYMKPTIASQGYASGNIPISSLSYSPGAVRRLQSNGEMISHTNSTNRMMNLIGEDQAYDEQGEPPTETDVHLMLGQDSPRNPSGNRFLQSHHKDTAQKNQQPVGFLSGSALLGLSEASLRVKGTSPYRGAPDPQQPGASQHGNKNDASAIGDPEIVVESNNSPYNSAAKTTSPRYLQTLNRSRNSPPSQQHSNSPMALAGGGNLRPQVFNNLLTDEQSNTTSRYGPHFNAVSPTSKKTFILPDGRVVTAMPLPAHGGMKGRTGGGGAGWSKQYQQSIQQQHQLAREGLAGEGLMAQRKGNTRVGYNGSSPARNAQLQHQETFVNANNNDIPSQELISMQEANNTTSSYVFPASRPAIADPLAGFNIVSKPIHGGVNNTSTTPNQQYRAQHRTSAGDSSSAATNNKRTTSPLTTTTASHSHPDMHEDNGAATIIMNRLPVPALGHHTGNPLGSSAEYRDHSPVTHSHSGTHFPQPPPLGSPHHPTGASPSLRIQRSTVLAKLQAAATAPTTATSQAPSSANQQEKEVEMQAKNPLEKTVPDPSESDEDTYESEYDAEEATDQDEAEADHRSEAADGQAAAVDEGEGGDGALIPTNPPIGGFYWVGDEEDPNNPPMLLHIPPQHGVMLGEAADGAGAFYFVDEEQLAKEELQRKQGHQQARMVTVSPTEMLHVANGQKPKSKKSKITPKSPKHPVIPNEEAAVPPSVIGTTMANSNSKASTTNQLQSHSSSMEQPLVSHQHGSSSSSHQLYKMQSDETDGQELQDRHSSDRKELVTVGEATLPKSESEVYQRRATSPPRGPSRPQSSPQQQQPQVHTSTRPTQHNQRHELPLDLALVPSVLRTSGKIDSPLQKPHHQENEEQAGRKSISPPKAASGDAPTWNDKVSIRVGSASVAPKPPLSAPPGSPPAAARQASSIKQTNTTAASVIAPQQQAASPSKGAQRSSFHARPTPQPTELVITSRTRGANGGGDGALSSRPASSGAAPRGTILAAFAASVAESMSRYESTAVDNSKSQTASQADEAQSSPVPQSSAPPMPVSNASAAANAALAMSATPYLRGRKAKGANAKYSEIVLRLLQMESSDGQLQLPRQALIGAIANGGATASGPSAASSSGPPRGSGAQARPNPASGPFYRNNQDYFGGTGQGYGYYSGGYALLPQAVALAQLESIATYKHNRVDYYVNPNRGVVVQPNGNYVSHTGQQQEAEEDEHYEEHRPTSSAHSQGSATPTSAALSLPRIAGTVVNKDGKITDEGRVDTGVRNDKTASVVHAPSSDHMRHVAEVLGPERRKRERQGALASMFDAEEQQQQAMGSSGDEESMSTKHIVMLPSGPIDAANLVATPEGKIRVGGPGGYILTQSEAKLVYEHLDRQRRIAAKAAAANVEAHDREESISAAILTASNPTSTRPASSKVVDSRIAAQAVMSGHTAPSAHTSRSDRIYNYSSMTGHTIQPASASVPRPLVDPRLTVSRNTPNSNANRSGNIMLSQATTSNPSITATADNANILPAISQPMPLPPTSANPRSLLAEPSPSQMPNVFSTPLPTAVSSNPMWSSSAAAVLGVLMGSAQASNIRVVASTLPQTALINSPHAKRVGGSARTPSGNPLATATSDIHQHQHHGHQGSSPNSNAVIPPRTVATPTGVFQRKGISDAFFPKPIAGSSCSVLGVPGTGAVAPSLAATAPPAISPKGLGSKPLVNELSSPRSPAAGARSARLAPKRSSITPM